MNRIFVKKKELLALLLYFLMNRQTNLMTTAYVKIGEFFASISFLILLPFIRIIQIVILMLI